MVMIPSLFDAPVYFAMWGLVAIVGIVFLVFPKGRKLKVAGGCVLAAPRGGSDMDVHLSPDWDKSQSAFSNPTCITRETYALGDPIPR
jgi:hypothetical protein